MCHWTVFALDGSHKKVDINSLSHHQCIERGGHNLILESAPKSPNYFSKAKCEAPENRDNTEKRFFRSFEWQPKRKRFQDFLLWGLVLHRIILKQPILLSWRVDQSNLCFWKRFETMLPFKRFQCIHGGGSVLQNWVQSSDIWRRQNHAKR